MIYLYVKTHNITGLKYFGKTTKDNLVSYKGSGKYWIKHLKKHGTDLTTEIIGEFYNEQECEDFAIKFSIQNDIVNSPMWANLREENGLDGAPVGNILSDDTKLKISKKLRGKKSPKSSYIMRESSGTRSNRARENMTGLKWYNNGIEQIRIKAENALEGWVAGRLPNIYGDKNLGLQNVAGNNTKGKKIYNNGIRHAYFLKETVPDGWIQGKMDGYQGGNGSMKKGKTYGKNAD
jgi:hypothetical protein